MIEFMPESGGNVLGVHASDHLTNRDYEEIWIPQMKDLIQTYGTVRLLLYLDEDFRGWEAGALWEDAMFGMRHARDFDKIAVVGGPAWTAWGMTLMNHLMQGEVQTFSGEQLQAAWRWIEDEET
jgi:hypothetical protein